MNGGLNRTKRILTRSFFLFLLPMGCLSSPAQTVIFNCATFSSTGACGIGSGQNFRPNGAVHLSSPNVTFIPTGLTHVDASLWWSAPVNIQQFTSNFKFVPNGQNFAFVVQNNVSADGNGTAFNSGAGCEAGFYQAFEAPPIPNHLLALELDSYSPLTLNASFSYSSAQIYQANQSPCLPNDTGPGYVPMDKFSTYPVNLTAGSQNTTTGDIYSVALTYDGSTLKMNMYDVTAGGSCPGAQCFSYSWATDIPALVGSSTAYVGFTGATGLTSSYPLYVNSFSFTQGLGSRATAPTATPAGGTYTGTQSVALSTTSSGAVICYSTTGTPATNGSSDCAAGTLYTGPVTVSSTETLYAVAGGTGYSDSVAFSGNYVIQASVTTPTFSPAAGTYASAQSVSISDATSSATIYYTTNGAVPNTSSSKYTGPITVSSTEKLEAIATSAGDANSAVASAMYTISSLPAAATPTFLPPAGTYYSAPSVTISAATSGASIYYTTDGGSPSTSSIEYTGPVSVSSTETLRAISVANGDSNSAVGAAAYTINLALPAVATPAFAPAAGTYSSAQTVAISDPNSAATIYYTTDGSIPTTSSTEYAGPITVSSSETLKASAVSAGYSNSAIASAAYTIKASSLVVATPVFSPAAGAYTAAQSVTLSDATPGASIYYTTNGATPTTSSVVYSGPIQVSATETLQAIATKTGDSNSAVVSAAYTITASLPSVATPTILPAAGIYPSAQSVTIADTTPGAAIYYTTDGTTPSTSSTIYASPITVTSSETVQALAASSGNSAIASAAYTITMQPNFMLGTSASALKVNAGGQGTVMVTVTPENGFSSPVVLACTGLPVWATCSFGETTVTPSGGAATTQLTISASTQAATFQHAPGRIFPFAALGMTVWLFGLRVRRASYKLLVLVVLSAGLIGLFGCSTTSGAAGASSPAPSSSTSTVTVTAISGTLTGSAPIAVTVN